MRFFIVIISICVIALTATIGTIVVGQQTFEGIVTDNPYETGLAWDETQKRKAELGWTVKLSPARFKAGKNELLAEVLDKEGVRIAHAAVNMTISRPSTNKYDQTYGVVSLPDGRYKAMILLPLQGTWNVTVAVVSNNNKAKFEHAVVATQENQ